MLHKKLEEKITSFPAKHLKKLSDTFQENGFVRIPNLLKPALLEKLRSEVENIVVQQGNDKNLLMKSTGNTPRRMCTVGQHILSKESKSIPAIYASDVLRSFLTNLAGEEVFRAPWPPEEYVLSNLYRNGDTHGWHWDDYSFAVVFYLKAPEVEQGGLVQTCAGGSWDKANPQINQTLLKNPIYTHRCEAGDAYMLNAKELLHRVTPITHNGERLILNMTWASYKDLSRDISHETNDVLFAT